MNSLLPTFSCTYNGQPVDRGPGTFGLLRDSADCADNAAELRERFAADGYLYLPGLLEREKVLAARLAMLEKLDRDGLVDRRFPLHDGVVDPNASTAFMPKLAHDNPALNSLLYDGPMMALFHRFFGGPVRHFDYTWVRCKGGRQGCQPTYPHYDIVYMGRGTDKLVTAWMPLGDVPCAMGGLLILENSHRLAELRRGYARFDVDRVCGNRPDGRPDREWEGDFGWYSADAFKVQRSFGGRWLTANYRAGDLLLFSMYTMHCSMDNQTDRFRLSTDSRYQPAGEAIDERWIGQDPPAHGDRAKRETIC